MLPICISMFVYNRMTVCIVHYTRIYIYIYVCDVICTLSLACVRVRIVTSMYVCVCVCVCMCVCVCVYQLRTVVKINIAEVSESPASHCSEGGRNGRKVATLVAVLNINRE